MTFVSTVQQGIGETDYHGRARFRVRLLSTLSAVGAVCFLAVAAHQYSSINVDEANDVKPGFVGELDIFAIILVSESTVAAAAILNVPC